MTELSIYSIIDIFSQFFIIIIGYSSLFIILSYVKKIRQDKMYRTLDALEKIPITEGIVLNEVKLFYAGPIIDSTNYPNEYELQKMKSALDVLNHFESISMAIRMGLYDEKIVKGYAKSTFVNNFIKSKNMIHDMREVSKNPNLFSDYEALVVRWTAREVE